MLIRSLLLWVFSVLTMHLSAAVVSGIIKGKNDQPLPFASLIIKGSTKGTTANSKGVFSLQLDPGNYVLMAQYIGFQTLEKKLRVGNTDLQIDFVLEEQQLSLNEVVVRSGGEDPAYAIIRKAIENREAHLHEIRKFQCDVYLKGQLQLKDFPKRFMGKDVDFEDGDSSKKKMIFLSESVAKYAVEYPSDSKIEVVSSKLSGRSDGFGFSNPQNISFYENNISLGRGLNPRGFISPISDHALNFYRYKFEGSFYEHGKEISRIKVIPKRKFEPLFDGYINIVENDWRIQSLQLRILKEQQMQLLDTLRIEQIYIPATKDAWVIKQQVIYPSGKILGFDFFGNFLQVYDHFDINPVFQKKFFNSTRIKFSDSANKRSKVYWDSIRPIPLLSEEQLDYRKKDSLEQVRRDPHYMDSLDKKNNKFRFSGLLITGLSHDSRRKKEHWTIPSLLYSLQYNTVEGAVLDMAPHFTKRYEGRQLLSLSPELRYGIDNRHLNSNISMGYRYGKNYQHTISGSFGTNVMQFNNAGVINPLLNSYYTLMQGFNFMKIYEAGYVKLGYAASVGNGLRYALEFQYQDRQPLENLADPVRWKKNPGRDFTPNYPTEISGSNMPHHSASILTCRWNWKPGSKYIEMPDQKIEIGSNAPNISASLSLGVPGLFGSDVSYAKWNLHINDNLPLKLAGRLNYMAGLEGFLNSDKVFIPDMIHFQGNQTIFAVNYLSSFQLATYYQFSNSATFNAFAHLEYHLNGLLTNKMPVLKKMNWFLVTGISGIHISNGMNYVESHIGIENIFKVLRFDYIEGYLQGGGKLSGIKITMPLTR